MPPFAHCESLCVYGERVVSVRHAMCITTVSDADWLTTAPVCVAPGRQEQLTSHAVI